MGFHIEVEVFDQVQEYLKKITMAIFIKIIINWARLSDLGDNLYIIGGKGLLRAKGKDQARNQG